VSAFYEVVWDEPPCREVSRLRLRRHAADELARSRSVTYGCAEVYAWPRGPAGELGEHVATFKDGALVPEDTLRPWWEQS
jgi:hypothetical protein